MKIFSGLLSLDLQDKLCYLCWTRESDIYWQLQRYSKYTRYL